MSNTKKVYFSLIIFALLNFLLLALIIFPIWTSIKKDAEDFVSYKEELVSTESQIENLREVKAMYNSYQSVLDKIDLLFVDREAPIAFLNFLEKTAQDSQVLIRVSSATLTESKDSSWPFFNFQISAYGLTSNLLRFLEKLENSPYLIETQTLTVAKLIDTGLQVKDVGTLPPGSISTNFSIKVFTK